VDLLRLAKRWGAPVSAEVCPHHFVLSVDHLREPDPDYKMNPPLRSVHDQQALLDALRDGVIEVIATDHAPHAAEEKGQGFLKAPFGIVGLETAVSLCLDRLVRTGVLGPTAFVRALAVRPAEILGLEARGLAPGNAAHVTVLDLEGRVTVDRNAFVSRSRNTPFHGMSLMGRVRATLVRGRVKFHDPV
jgi:dihydroorotase